MAPKVAVLAVAAGAAYSATTFVSPGGRSVLAPAEPQRHGAQVLEGFAASSSLPAAAFIGALAAGIGAGLSRRARTDKSVRRAGGNVVDVAAEAGAFSTLLAAVKKVPLVQSLLMSSGPVTVFAPTDDAFKAFLEKQELSPDQLLRSTELDRILKHHVVKGKVMAKDVKAGVVSTVQQSNLVIEVGDKVRVGGATVTKTDIEATNGVIHVVDRVIVPNTVVDVAVGAGAFTTLVAAVQKAELVDALSGPGPFTVFAPSDDAFRAFLTKNNLTPEKLLANPDLAKILKHHVILGSVFAKDVKSGSVQTLAGTSLKIEVGGSVVVGGAKVAKTDVVAGNGVIHVIEDVILP